MKQQNMQQRKKRDFKQKFVAAIHFYTTSLLLGTSPILPLNVDGTTMLCSEIKLEMNQSNSDDLSMIQLETISIEDFLIGT